METSTREACLLVQDGEQRQLHPVRSAKPDVPVPPRSLDQIGELLGARLREPFRRRGRVLDLEGEADGAGDAPLSDLDLVHQARLVDGQQLERRAPRVEDGSAPGFLVPFVEDGQTEDVSIEADRLRIVVDGKRDAQLADRALRMPGETREARLSFPRGPGEL